MALGARRSWVLGPLVLEALSMTFAGGVLGLSIGSGLVQVLGYFQSQATDSAMAFMGRPPDMQILPRILPEVRRFRAARTIVPDAGGGFDKVQLVRECQASQNEDLLQ
jgi:hypothetical protein